MMMIKVEDEMTLETALVSLLPDFEVEVSGKVDGSLLILATINHDHLGYHDHLGQRQESTAIRSEAKAAHREVVQYRDLLLLQKVSLHKSVNYRTN